MKHRSSVIFITLFLLLSLLPLLGMLISGPSPLLANETAARTPAFRNRDGTVNTGVLEDTTNYIGARFAFRPALVSVRSFLYEHLLRTSAEEQVILGSGGQLYYSSTLEDYSGVPLSAEELATIADHLRAIQDSLEERGIRFLFAVAPNKNSLISENMPSRFPYHPETSNFRLLQPLLEEAGVHTVDLHAVLSGDPSLYYRTDSHWTPRGAAMAADALLEALGPDADSAPDAVPVAFDFSSGSFSEEGIHIGDLYQMLYPTGRGREPELIYTPGFTFATASDPRGGNAITIRTSCESGDRSLYCRRDSFGIALYPYLAEAFAEAEFSRSSDYSPEAFQSVEADVVILEIVERNLPSLLPDPA